MGDPASEKYPDSVERMLAYKERNPAVIFDLDPRWFAASVPGHDTIGAITLTRLMDKLEAIETSPDESLDTRNPGYAAPPPRPWPGFRHVR